MLKTELSDHVYYTAVFVDTYNELCRTHKTLLKALYEDIRKQFDKEELGGLIQKNEKKFAALESKKKKLSSIEGMIKEGSEMPSILMVESKRQHLTFNQLFGYYGMKGLKLREETFEENLDLRNKDGKYNLLA